MPYGFTPPSQKFRRIGFDLSGGGAAGQAELVIRPEELTWVAPSRIAVQQTLAGAWADSFDRGVATIRISGHTGWHGGSPLNGGVTSGEAAFQNLNEVAFQGWHDARSALAAAGQDVAAVEMIFIDELDRREALVAPKVFTLRRSKTRPLLSMYVIELLVLADAGQPTGGGADAFAGALGNFLQGASELTGIANNIVGLVQTGQAVINDPLAFIPGGLQLAQGNVLGAINAAQGAANNPLAFIPGAQQAQGLANGIANFAGFFG